MSWVVPESGLGTCVQVAAFQCRIRVLVHLVPEQPTAQALLADVSATPMRLPLMVTGTAGRAGLVWVATTTAAATATATPAAMAVLAGLTCRGLRCRRSEIRCTVLPCTAAGPPDGRRPATTSAPPPTPAPPPSP